MKEANSKPRGAKSLKKWWKDLVNVKEISLKEFAGLLVIGDLEATVSIPQPVPAHLPATAKAWLERKRRP